MLAGLLSALGGLFDFISGLFAWERDRTAYQRGEAAQSVAALQGEVKDAEAANKTEISVDALSDSQLDQQLRDEQANR